MKQPVYYELVKKRITRTGNMLVTAAVWSCAMCGKVIDGMGGPGNGEICEQCGDDIKNGRIHYMRENK